MTNPEKLPPEIDAEKRCEKTANTGRPGPMPWPTGTPTIQQDAPQEIYKSKKPKEGGPTKGELQLENKDWRGQHALGAFGPGADRGCLRQGAAPGRVGEDAV